MPVPGLPCPRSALSPFPVPAFPFPVSVPTSRPRVMSRLPIHAWEIASPQLLSPTPAMPVPNAGPQCRSPRSHPLSSGQGGKLPVPGLPVPATANPRTEPRAAQTFKASCSSSGSAMEIPPLPPASGNVTAFPFQIIPALPPCSFVYLACIAMNIGREKLPVPVPSSPAFLRVGS